MSSPLLRFHPLISQWFTSSLGNPTDVQLCAWEEVSAGRHVLVTAPTGSGKTLAAFLWAINQLVTGAWGCGETRVLYISPLKALNNDVRRNLLIPLQELEVCFAQAGEAFPTLNVQTRSGDTPGGDRRRMLRSPPEILITTPESLNILLTSKNSRHMLTGITTVILDEIHAVAGTKRGTHLITAVERLVPLCGEFQRIALSATVRPLETVAEFVGGFIRRGEIYENRPVSIVRGDQAKKYRIIINAPEEETGEGGEEFWPRLVLEFRKIIARNRSTLFFANSRRTTERVTRLINEGEGEEVAYSHHGSLSREIRLAVEERLKRGELKAIVATNSLELGIDIGRLDCVVLIQSPRSITSAIQRIGRSGHGVGEVSNGLLFPTLGMDFVEAAVIARAIADGEIEALRPVESPLDLLAQIVLSMALAEEWELDGLYDFLKTAYPYRNLSRRHFDLIIGMLEGGYSDSHIYELRPRATVDRLANTIATRSGVSGHLFMEGGTIPERGYFELRLKENGAKIGELDEEFVWERRIGDSFALGSQVWQITGITHNAVEVIPARKAQQIIPFWRAEEQDRDAYYSVMISSFLEACNDRLADLRGFVREMTIGYSMDGNAAEALARFLQTQKETTKADLPHRHHLLVEHYSDPLARSDTEQVVLHTLWGNHLNRPFTFALAAAWHKQYGYPLQGFYSNDGIALLLPQEFDIRRLFSLVTPENIEALLRTSLEATGYFGARFRENAGRALLLSKINFKRRMPLWLNRLRSRKLLSSISKYGDFPILLETWRSCLQDDFDLPALNSLLAEIQEGEIGLTECWTTLPSPFARGLVWQQTNKHIYEDDTPDSASGSRLGHDLIKELLYSPHLRPRIPDPLITAFENKRQRTAEGYTPDSSRDLIDWVKERLLIPAGEWSRLLDAMVRDHGIDIQELLAETAERVALVEIPGAAAPLVAAIEMLPEIGLGVGRAKGELHVIPLLDKEGLNEKVQHSVEKIFGRHAARYAEQGREEEGPSAARFLGQWLSAYGPVELALVEQTLGIRHDLLHEALTALEETGQIVLDQFGMESRAPEVCDAVNLEALLRIFRRSRQPVFEALDMAQLPLFLASFQGLTQRGTTLDELRKRLEQLFGFPLSANAWEEEVLPARMEPYFTAWLDSLMQTSDLLWFGCGERKLSFAFPEDLDLYRQSTEPAAEADLEMARRLIPDPKARYSLSAIRSISGLPPEMVTSELWKLAWKGEIGNDSMVPVRKWILNRFMNRGPGERDLRRLPVSRWKSAGDVSGNWYLLKGDHRFFDVLDREEMNKDRVRVLLERYGLLFRELLLHELPPLQWQRLFRTLRIMELSGEVLSGNFFNGIPGLQFISHEAYRMLTRGMPEERIYWINAADPVSLCGLGLEAIQYRLPSRLPTTHLVFHGSRLVVISRRYGRVLQIETGPDDPRLHEYLSFFRILLAREFSPRKQIVVERINGVPAGTSPYRPVLKGFGFQESYKGLELWRRY